ncbi:Ig-like domain-containing protein, partial [Citrobacter amalonaticus]|uniref:beta strand repeat-containing protein n=1 Tax=Citrobacter amalonaticus TaxID=35703 RepID=UPI00300DA711
ISAEATSTVGNKGTATHDFTIDLTAPGITIDKVAGDDIINSAEHGVAQIISGTTTGVTAGTAVQIHLNGQDYTAYTDASGNWSVGVPAADITALAEGKATITADVLDAAGNKGSATRDITTDLTGPALGIDKVTSDDIVNAAEKGADLTLSGTCGNDVATMKVTLNGKTYDAIVSNGTWSLTVPAADVAKLADGTATVTAQATDTTGNTTTATHDFSVVADSSHLPAVTINALGDDWLNAAEMAVDQTINGKVTNAAAGDTVKVTLNGKDYTATVGADLTWSITVPAADLALMTDGKATITAQITVVNGNTGSTTHDITIDTTAPVITIDKVAGDDIINSAEHGVAQIISGTATGVSAGATVTVTLNGKTYTTTTDASGNWSVGVNAADVSSLADGIFVITAEVRDPAGNTGSANHNVTIDTTGPDLTIDTVAGNDTIDAVEKEQALTITGTCSAGTGQVTVLIGGKSYTATIEGTTWSVALTEEQTSALPAGDLTVVVSGTDSIGNSSTASRPVHVDGSTTPAIIIDSLTADNRLNKDEVAQSQDITGKVLNAAVGDDITVTLNGKTYTTKVAADLTWKVTVDTADLAGLPEGTVAISATVTAKNNTSGESHRDVIVDTIAPVITIDKVAGDDIINSAEHNGAQIISGTATGVSAGATVTVTLNGKTYTTTTDATGKWSVGVPTADIQALNGTAPIVITADVNDAAGNKGSATHNITVDLTSPAVAINTVSSDDFVNAAEKGADITLSGTCGTDVTSIKVTVNGQDYIATVTSGTWTATLPAADVALLADGKVTVTANATNTAGNTASATHDFTVDSIAPAVTADNVTADNIVNTAEKGGDITLSGTCAPDTKTVTVTLNGHDYTATVSNGTWTATLPAANAAALTDGSQTLSVKATDNAGNSTTISKDFTVNTAVPSVTISDVTADNILNAAEHNAAQVITGTATADSAVVVTLNSKTYTTTADASGNWSIGVPAAEIQALSGTGPITVSAVVTGANGNSSTATHDFTLDLTGPAITIDNVTTDNVVNSAEKGADLALTGTCDSDAKTVRVTINGKGYDATVSNGTWSVTVPATDAALLPEGNVAVHVDATDNAGNPASKDGSFTVNTAAPVITIDNVTADNTLNTAEHGAAQTLSGTVTGVAAGTTVTIKLNGQTYTATTDASGKWSTSVAATDIQALAEGTATISAEVTNTAGNTGTASHDFVVDLTAPVVTADNVTADNIVNATEKGGDIALSGTCAVDTKTVIVTLNGKDYTATVSNGTWTAAIPAVDAATLTDGNQTLSINATDNAGNSATISKDFTIDTSAPTITINTVATDDVINATEHATSQMIKGSTTGVDIGTQITLELNGKTHHATTDASGNWTVIVSSVDMTALAEGTTTIKAEVSDKAGNTSSVTHDVSVDLTAPAVTVDNVTADNIVNVPEKGDDIVITGTCAVDTKTVSVKLNDISYSATVTDGTWSITVKAADAALWADGTQTASVTATDKSGNKTTVSKDFTVDTSLPSVTISDVTADNILNAAEHNAAQVITGTATAGSTVVITLNGKSYNATADVNGNW